MLPLYECVIFEVFLRWEQEFDVGPRGRVSMTQDTQRTGLGSGKLYYYYISPSTEDEKCWVPQKFSLNFFEVNRQVDAELHPSQTRRSLRSSWKKPKASLDSSLQAKPMMVNILYNQIVSGHDESRSIIQKAREISVTNL